MATLTEYIDQTTLQYRMTMRSEVTGRKVAIAFTHDYVNAPGRDFDKMRADAIRAMTQTLENGWQSANDPSSKFIVECIYCGNKSTDRETNGGKLPCYCRIPSDQRNEPDRD